MKDYCCKKAFQNFRLKGMILLVARSGFEPETSGL